RIVKEKHFLISDPKSIAHIFRHDTARYYRGKYHELLKPVFGDGLLTANGESWRQPRRLIESHFSRQYTANWLDIIINTTEARIAAWRKEVSPFSLDMTQAMSGLIQEINTKILFGRTLSYRAHPVLLNAVNIINSTLLRQVKQAMLLDGLLNRLPLPSTRRFRKAVARLHQTVDDLITHTHAHAGDDEALYVVLCRATEQSACPFQLRDQLITLFLAGHETTAVALAWIFYYLTKHPEWLDLLYNEIVDVLGDRSPTIMDLERLDHTRRVVDESLRLRPPIYGIGRRARVEDTVGGYRIPVESPVVVSPYVMHHHPAYWDCPDRFDPNRFLPERAAARPPFTYFPFGGGPHVCIGRHLAIKELLAIVALVVRAFRMMPPLGRRVVPQPAITLRPHPGMPVRIAPR
ncbi:MAG: cytochrome P450, partial [Candidatus Competibacteraceae bacterium]|nr:cytochrome P450 [Candidatus Competibacteraceae bacterium]